MLLQDSQGKSQNLSKNRFRISIPIIEREYERIIRFCIAAVTLYGVCQYYNIDATLTHTTNYLCLCRLLYLLFCFNKDIFSNWAILKLIAIDFSLLFLYILFNR